MKPKIAILPFPAAGHLSSILLLARAMEKRGYEIVVYSVADGEKHLREKDFNSVRYGETKLPLGSIARMAGGTVRNSSYSAITSGLRFHRELLDASLNELAARLEAERPVAIVGDELFLCGPTLGKALEIPWIGVSQTLSIYPDRTGASAPAFIDPRESGALARRAGVLFVDLVFRYLAKGINQHRVKRAWPPHRRIEDAFSKDLHLLPYSREFSGRGPTPAHFKFLGPFLKPVDIETKRDVCYASLGTLVSPEKKTAILGQAARAFRNLGETALISWGSRDASTIPEALREQVLPRVDQLEVLSRAKLMLTHGGLNSVQECIHFGVPMLVVPIKHDQLGIAARVRELGIGEVISPREATADRLAKSIRSMLDPERYAIYLEKLAIQKFAAQQGGGLDAAVAMIERVLHG